MSMPGINPEDAMIRLAVGMNGPAVGIERKQNGSLEVMVYTVDDRGELQRTPQGEVGGIVSQICLVPKERL